VSVTAEIPAPTKLFFTRVASATHRVLFLDYDGTLAPIVVDRRHAPPYPGIVELVAKVRDQGTRVVVVSGRVAADVRRLIDFAPPFEIWGSHGFERLLPNGELRYGHSDAAFEDAVTRAHEALTYEGLGDRVELKPSGIAVHWRGLADGPAREVAAIAERILARVTDFHAFLVAFDGGLELRAQGYDKGLVVRAVMAESPGDAVAAFLGDDFTDEDGFRAVQHYGVGVLVRDQYRATEAEFWLRPPADLAVFLRDWYAAAGGAQ
jgi:trehalose 6-phosphate phosphatase